MVSSREGENCHVGVAFFSVKKDVMHEMLFMIRKFCCILQSVVKLIAIKLINLLLSTCGLGWCFSLFKKFPSFLAQAG